MERKQFTFYRSFWNAIQILPTKKEKLQVFELICSYSLDGIEPDMDAVKPSAAMTFALLKPVLENARKRSQNALTVNRL